MTNTLTRAARETIKASGLTIRAFILENQGDENWHGDDCGCTDDRCIGFHHEEHEECGCLPVLIEETKKQMSRRALLENADVALEAMSLEELAHLRAAIEGQISDSVQWMRKYGFWTWESIAQRLGVTKQAAQQRYGRVR